MGWDYTKRTIHIESKVYHLEFDKKFRGSRVRIKESSNRGVYSFSIQFVSLVWLWECFQQLLATNANVKFFKQTRCDDYSLWVEKKSNKRGYVAEVFKLDNNGHKCSILVPEGSQQQGWSLFRNLIEDYPGNREQLNSSLIPKQDIVGRSFAETVKGADVGLGALKKGKEVGKQSNEIFVPTSVAESEPLKDEISSIFEKVEWEKTFVISRRFFHQDWTSIIIMLQEDFNPYCAISPFHPNRALLFCRTEDLAHQLCAISGWNSFKDLQIKFEFWNPVLHARMDVVPSFGGWVKVRNLPLHLWNLETLQAIGDRCGGLIEVSPKTTMFRETMEALIKVKGNYMGFIPAEVEVGDPSGLSFTAQITTHFSTNLLVKKMDRVHGTFDTLMEEDFVRKLSLDTSLKDDWIPVKQKSSPLRSSLANLSIQEKQIALPKTPCQSVSKGASSKATFCENSTVEAVSEKVDVSAKGDGSVSVRSDRAEGEDVGAVSLNGPVNTFGPLVQKACRPGPSQFVVPDGPVLKAPSSQAILYPTDFGASHSQDTDDLTQKLPRFEPDPSFVKILQRSPKVLSQPVHPSPFTNQPLSLTNKLPKKNRSSSLEGDSDATPSSPPTDRSFLPRDQVTTAHLQVTDLGFSEKGALDLTSFDGDFMEENPLPLNSSFIEEDPKMVTDEEDLYITSNGEICNSRGENKMKLGVWLDSTTMKIIPKGG